MCHIPLNNISGLTANPNLVRGTDTGRVASGWSINGWGGSFTHYSTAERCYKFVTNNGWSVVKYKASPSLAGKTVTISFWARKSGSETTATEKYSLFYSNNTGTNPYSSGSFDIIDDGGTGHTGETAKPSNVWMKYKKTMVVNADNQIGIGAFCVPESSGYKTTYLIKDLKIEEGNTVTDWCPNENDALYKYLGYDSGTISDCSGYDNNASIVNTNNLLSNTSSYQNYTLHKADTDGMYATTMYKNGVDTNFYYTVSCKCNGTLASSHGGNRIHLRNSLHYGYIMTLLHILIPVFNIILIQCVLHQLVLLIDT